MFNEQLFHHDRVSLNFATGPRNGPALVFFHGVTRRWQCFVPLIPTLSARWHVHVLEHRGHGLSSRVPAGYLVKDYVRDAVAFFDTYLFDPALRTAVGDEEHLTLDLETVRHHAGVCLDACHMAVEFEDPADGLAQLGGAGIPVLKVQVSSALSLSGQTPAELATALAPFLDETYLHQVVERHNGAFDRYVDLPDGLAAAASQADQSARDWRVHFHVPIFLERLQGFDTTQAYLAALLAQARAQTPCTCYEVETYTWDVLPAEYRTVDVCTAIARELTWARGHLQ